MIFFQFNLIFKQELHLTSQSYKYVCVSIKDESISGDILVSELFSPTKSNINWAVQNKIKMHNVK